MGKLLHITKCGDPMMWYAGMVGQNVPLVRVLTDCYMGREPAGFSNIVKLGDAEILDCAPAVLPVEPSAGPYETTWNYHQHGEHTFFPLTDWGYEAYNEDTVLGYQDWTLHKLKNLLDDTDLDGVDAIEVAGCIDRDGNVEVTSGEKAKYFSVYTRTLDVGVECICDFNTKAQAVEFARALAARTGISVYGNCCSIEEAQHA